MDSSTSPATSSFTRRRVLGWGGVGAFGAITGYFSWPRHELGSRVVLKGADVVPVAENQVRTMPSAAGSQVRGMGRDAFVAHLESVFVLESGASCTLVEVGAARKLVAPSAEFTSFSLLFSAPAGFSAESRIYRLSHREMGEMDLFLSPVGYSKGKVSLEAIFSQRV
jgi:hypothetical protein